MSKQHGVILEPEAVEMFGDYDTSDGVILRAAQVSAAISAKRIADALEELYRLAQEHDIHGR